MKQKIRMIGFDLDGTMLDSKKQVLPENIEAVKKATSQGVVVLPATGRPQAGVPEEVLKIPGIRYLLASNGTRILDLSTGEVIYQVRMSHEQTMHLARTFAEITDGLWELYAEGKCFVNKSTYRFVNHPTMTPEMIRYLSLTRTYIDDLPGYMEKHRMQAEKFQVFYENEGQKNRVMEILKREGNLDVSSSSVYNLEIVLNRAGKGNGLLALGELLRISKEEIMAIGDSSNDWDMLRKVGFPVVMGNSDKETRKLGKYVTKTNDECGVAYAIEQLVLKETYI